jgi:hypothetical protein
MPEHTPVRRETIDFADAHRCTPSTFAQKIMKNKFQGLLSALILSTLTVYFAGCEKSETSANEVEPLGILSAESKAGGVDLELSLKDELKLKVFIGDTASSEMWINTFNNPAQVEVRMDQGLLTIGAFSEQFDTKSINLNTDFSDITIGVRELLIGTLDDGDSQKPIIIKLVPTSPEEKKSINAGKIK